MLNYRRKVNNIFKHPEKSTKILLLSNLLCNESSLKFKNLTYFEKSNIENFISSIILDLYVWGNSHFWSRHKLNSNQNIKIIKDHFLDIKEEFLIFIKCVLDAAVEDPTCNFTKQERTKTYLEIKEQLKYLIKTL